MGRIQKIILSAAVLSILVIIISLAASETFSPNKKTPIKKLVPENSFDSTEINANGKVIAAWVWEYPTEIENIEQIINFSTNEGINTLYIYVDEYIDIYELTDKNEKDRRMNEYLSVLKDIVSKARENNITIHALSGYTGYSYDSHDYIPPLIIDHIFEFNEQNPDSQIEGIQFDIEFYEDPRFYDSTDEYTQSFLGLVDRLSTQVQELNEQYNDNMALGFVIPFWFDETNEYLTKPIIQDLINPLARLENGYLVVMSYRNIIEGEGNVMEISKNELEAAADTPVKIIIAQEIVENKEEKITHHGKSKKEIKNFLQQIIDKASVYNSFQGVSIHELKAFMRVD